MATSTNYGWAEPDNSSLVKNGASDMRTLGNAIDVSLWNSGFGQAGKNKIINGNFGIWQRGTSFSNPAQLTYQADRWTLAYYDAQPTTYSITQQSFAAGTAPVSGYEGTFFARSTITTVGSNTIFRPIDQKIEDVRTFAGQTVTFSLWAKADSARTFTMNFQQNFGTGGSGAVGGSGQVQTLSTSWQRFTWTFNMPSISGKTIGTGSNVEVIIQQASASGSVLDVWGVQLEAGSVATPFQTATGTIQGELAAAMRYYQVLNRTAVSFIGMASSTTAMAAPVQFVQPMRAAPTVTMGTAGKNAGEASFLTSVAGYPTTVGTHAANNITAIGFELAGSGYSASYTAGNATNFYSNGNQNVYTASAEL